MSDEPTVTLRPGVLPNTPTVKVKGRQCPYDPTPLLGLPLGQFHCELCGCMVIAGMSHGPCLPNDCPLLDAEGNDEASHPHPGTLLWVELTEDDAAMLGIPTKSMPS